MLQQGIVYIKDKDTVSHHLYGYRDLANHIPITETTRFPTASAGKVFVATAILHLIEEGKITLDTTLKDCLTFDLGNLDPDVTVYQLLTHTSGVPNYFNEEKTPNYADLWMDIPNYRIRSSKDLLPLFINESMWYPKGSRFEYNDSGFVLLGLIIEAITDKPFDEYLHQWLFEPLGMIYTGYYELDRLPENCANGYIFDEKRQEYYTNIYSIDAKGTGAGGAFTNAIDVQLFWEALISHKLLSEEMTKNMLHKHQTTGDWGYGLGIWLDEENNPIFMGEDPGATFITYYNRSTHKQITLISNIAEDVFHLLAELKK